MPTPLSASWHMWLQLYLLDIGGVLTPGTYDVVAELNGSPIASSQLVIRP